MAKLQRKDVKIFSSNPNDATQVSTFLTAKDVTPDYSSDPNAIQNANYTKGWLARGNDNLPQVEDMNGVMYAESYKNAYLYQMGIAEWSASGEYYENSYCQVDGVFYKSLIDNNVNNNPTTDDGTKWAEIPLEPYTGENIGTAEGVYAGKTVNNELQFKGIAVTGNGSISASDDTITIAIGGGGTGDVYWGAIGGTLSSQSDLQQALNQKQGLIGYTPEDVANKVTTIRTGTVATDTAYPSELATRTAIESAITSANAYTDNALTNLATDAFVLYANSWTDVYTGTLTTTAPTGTGTTHTLSSISSSAYENIANFSYTTTQETTFNSTFTYDVLVPIRNADIFNWLFKFTLTITHADVNGGLATTLFNYESSNLYPTDGDLNIEIKQDLLGIDSITYPTGSVINFKIQAKAENVTPPHDFDLLVYDQDNPIVISRNKGINKNLVTAFNTQALGTEQNQEYFNTYINNSLAGKQNTIQDVSFTSSSTQVFQEPNTSKTSFLGTDSKPYNYAYIDQIGDSNDPTTSIYTTNLTASNFSTDTVNTHKVNNSYNDIDYIEYVSGTTADTREVKYNAGTTNSNYGRHVFYTGGTKKLSITDGAIITNTEVRPTTDGTSSIGNASYAYNNGYFNNLYTDDIQAKTTTTPSTYTTEKSLEINKFIFDFSSFDASSGTGTLTLNTIDISSNAPITTPSDAHRYEVYLGQNRSFDKINTKSLVLNGTNYSSIPSPANNGSYAIKMNNATKGTVYADGTGANTIDLGTVITSTSDCVKIAGSTMTGGLIINYNNNNQLTLRRNNNDVVLFNDTTVSNAYRPKFSYKIDGTNYTAVAAKSAWNFASDKRLKKNIKSIENGLDIVEKLNPVKFDFKDDKRDDSYESGFIAQEVQEVIPQAVSEDENGYLNLGTTCIIPYLTSAVKELKEKVEYLELRVEELEKAKNDGRE